ncbi:MAG: T9SS type A sorting domain-containing protein [Flavobacteriales bacterium]|nr:T9SS type A sorting domain-containing protein [Flavobacteriales bacterium]
MALVLSVPFISAYDNGVAEQQNRDRTGAPGSDAHCGVSCHNGQAFSPSLEIRLIDMMTNEEVTEYIAGNTYIMEWEITASGNPGSYGFQATALLDNEANAGTFQSPGTDVQLEDVDGRHIVEHSMDSPTNTFSTEWVAPSTGSGEVTVYASSVAANNNGSNSGDGFAPGTASFTEAATSIEDVTNAEINLRVINKQLQITNVQDKFMTIYDLRGQKIGVIQNASDVVTYDLSSQSNGIYIIAVEDESEQYVKKFMLN